MTKKKSIKEFLDDFNENPEETAKKIAEGIIKQRQEIQENFDKFLSRAIEVLENTDKESIEIKVEENGLFVSENIEKVLVEVNKKGWDILNMLDFEYIKNCPKNQTGFLYTQLLNLSLKLEKNEIYEENSIGKIILKLIEKNIYSEEEIFYGEFKILGGKLVKNKLIFDIYNTVKNTELIANYKGLFMDSINDDFLEKESGFRFEEGLLGILKEKYSIGEINKESIICIVKEFNLSSDEKEELIWYIEDNYEKNKSK